MCLLVFAYNCHPLYRFVLAGNRDEFHSRPARAAQWWDDADLLAGRDEKAGGTWLGVSRGGNFGVVTNFREMAPPLKNTRSRGELITRYAAEGEEFLTELATRHADYSGYNLVAGNLRSGPLHYHSNRGACRQIDTGLHGVSNHQLDTPWPKLTRSVTLLRGLMQQPTLMIEDLLDLLADRTQANDELLPRTGVSIELERLLSAPFIVSPDYGTRCSSAILLTRTGHLQFAERRYDVAGNTTGESRFGFPL